MKIAVLSDIHGNFDALNAVTGSLEFLECDLRINLGDSIGYYFQPVSVLDQLDKLGFLSVRGNHEVFLRQASESIEFLKEMDSKYGIGLRECLNTISNEKLFEITNWPRVREIETDRGTLVVAHGSLESENDYVYPDSDLNLISDQVSTCAEWLCLGNTHWPMLRFFNGTKILNPGSVGQPRNGTKGANWAIVDTVSNSIRFVETQYDSSEVVRLTKMHQPQMSKLWEIFTK